jgi:hypothetical protein
MRESSASSAPEARADRAGASAGSASSVKKEGVVYPRHLPGGLATLRGDGGSGNGVAQMV